MKYIYFKYTFFFRVLRLRVSAEEKKKNSEPRGLGILQLRELVNDTKYVLICNGVYLILGSFLRSTVGHQAWLMNLSPKMAAA